MLEENGRRFAEKWGAAAGNGQRVMLRPWKEGEGTCPQMTQMGEGIIRDSETGEVWRMLEWKEIPASGSRSMLTVRRVFICVHLRHLRTGNVFDRSASR